MFQWPDDGGVCVKTCSLSSLVRSKFLMGALLVLLLLHDPGRAVAGTFTPEWTVPDSLTSDDGYAFLGWTAGEGNPNSFFRITETFNKAVYVHYIDATDLRAWRMQPGEYDFVLQACVKNKTGEPDCSKPSDTLTLTVTEAVTATLLTETTAGSADAITSVNPAGGPDQLQPGHWHNPAKDGHGWSFYWSNRLALAPNDPLFGNNYDLLGIWYTYEAKYAVIEPGCPTCPPDTRAYRPVALKLKAVSTAANSFGGSLFASRNDGSEIWVGSAAVIFGSDQLNATINWNANFKKESLSDSDPLEFLLGSDPSDTTNISHLSGVWKRAGNDNLLLVTNIGSVAEVEMVVFHDDVGDPSWIQAVNPGSAVSSASNLCFAYQYEGYSPGMVKPSGWSKDWYLSGCDPAVSASTSNRNGLRYFSGLNREYFWVDFTLPGTGFASGSIMMGSSNSAVSLEKVASFHGISYDSASGASCELTGANPTCDVSLTWYTDGNYPDATAYARHYSTNTYYKILTSTQPAMTDIPYQISSGGLYRFELRMGDGEQTTLIARSDYFTVIDNLANSPPVLSVPADQINDIGDSVEMLLGASDPDAGDVLTFSENGLPSGLVMDVESGRISGTLSAAVGDYPVVATVQDNYGNSDVGSFTWKVIDPASNRPPTIGTVDTQNVVQAGVVSLAMPVDDPDADTLGCSANGSLPTGLSVLINAANSRCDISGSIQASVGFYTSTITVTDQSGASASALVSWNVMSVNGNPEVPPAPAAPPDMTASNSSSKVGATQGEFSVSESGSATYSIPILSAPSAGGVGPQISLNYSSQLGSGDVGVGWTLGGVSAVSRCPQTMEQDGLTGSRGIHLDAGDRFCLDGQRLIVDPTSGEYGSDGTRYRTEIDNFTRVTSYGSAGNGPAWFKVERKDGAVIEYGNSGDSRIEARGSDNPDTVLIWAQNRFEDRSSNYIFYSYLENSSGPVAYVLQAIDYTGNTRAGTLPSARLSFAYSERSSMADLSYRYLAGVQLEQGRLLQNIRSQGRLQTGAPLEDLRFYELSYEEDGVGRSILKMLTECRSPNRTICYQPTRFNWLKSESTIDTQTTMLDGLLPKLTLSGLLMADVSGDGRPDLLYTDSKSKGHFLYVKEATANAGFSEWAGSYKLPKKSDGLAPRIFAIDVNSDGIQDVAYIKYTKATGDYTWVALISNGSGFSAERELNSSHRFFLSSMELESRFRIMDFNGDGLSDILHAHTTVPDNAWRLTAFLNSTVAGGVPDFSAPIGLDVDNADLFPLDLEGGWELTTQPPFFRWTNSESGKIDVPDARIFDFNGDGAVDLLLKVWRSYQRCISNCVLQAATNGGNGGNKPDPVYQVESASFWVLMESSGQNTYRRHSIVARGDDCNAAEVCNTPDYQTLPRSKYVWPVDINADALADLAWGDEGGNWYFQLNTGNGFSAAVLIGLIPDDANKLARFEDWNGDGYPDLVYPSDTLDDNAKWLLFQNHFGRAFAASSNTQIPAGNVGGDPDIDPVENDASVFADFNGDGKIDQLSIDISKKGEVLSAQLRKGMNVSGSRLMEAANVIVEIINGQGLSIGIKYKPLTDRSVYSRMRDSVNAHWGNGSAVYDLVAPIYVVSQVSSSAPVFNDASARSQIQYHYVGAKIQAGGRGFLGFGEIISYDPQSQIRSNTRYRQDFPFIGLPLDTTRVSNAAGNRFSPVSNTTGTTPNNWGTVSNSTRFPASVSGTPLSYALSQWASKPTVTGAVFPYVADSIEIKYTLQGVFDRKELTSNNYDAYGNLVGSSVATFATDGTTVFAGRSTVNTYADDVSKWRLGQLTTSKVTHSRAGKSSITRNSRFAYDPVSGVLNQEIIEPDVADFRLTTEYQLDSFGNRRQTTVTGMDIAARKTSAKYDKLGRFVIETTNALNQVTQRINRWDAFGNPLSTENIDGVITTTVADGMGSPFATYTETGVWNKTLKDNGAGNNCPAATLFRTTAYSGGAPTQIHCFDVLGRPVRSAVSSLDGTYTYTDQYYDSSGRAARVSEPYFAGDTRYWNLTAYDDVGRITAVLAAGGDDIATDYDSQAGNLCTDPGVRVNQIINGLNQQRVEVLNARGEISAVYDEYCGLVTYDYDAVGNLEKMTGTDGAAVTMTYDLAGRKITLDDPDKGYWQYAYNSLGELTRQLDNKNQAVDFTYDAIGRVIDRRELEDVNSLADSAFTTVNRETTSYRATSPAKSQVAAVTYRAGELGAELHKKAFTYDGFGRVELASTTIASEQFVERTSYDQFSRLFQQFDASGGDRGIRYVYSNGYISQLREAREGLSGTIYQAIQAMDAHGNVTFMQLGNGVDAHAAYEPDSGKLIKLFAFDAFGVELMNVDYLFDVLGNLKKRHDLSTGADLQEVFGYDGLNRLNSVDMSVDAVASVQTLTLNYNTAGNITYKSDAGTYLYNADQPHAVSSVDGVSYRYDANGNQVAGAGREMSYTVFDKLNRITRGTSQVIFSYGVGNARYERQDYEGSLLERHTLYLGATERITENGSIFFKRYLGGVAIATYYPATGVQQLSYLLKDHVGSIHSVLDSSGLITATMHFNAFGERRDTDWQTPLTGYMYASLNDITTRGYTGHEQVDKVGIIHMNGRIYDPKLGRFLQADPVVQAPKNSQNLNRYSYVLNNPLSYTDPTGYSFKSFWKKIRPFVAIASSFFLTPYFSIITGSWVTGGALAGFVTGAIATGSIRGAVQGAFIGAIAGYVTQEISRGIRDWKSARANVYKVRYDPLSNKAVVELVADPGIVQIEKLHVNGMLTDVETAVQRGIEQLGITQEHLAQELHIFHNPTSGFMADLTESALGKITNTSSLSRQLATLLQQQSRSLVSVTAHSQGSIILTNALRQIGEGVLTTSTTIFFNGAAVSKNLARRVVEKSGASFGNYQSHFFDAVPNIIGLNTYNPLRIVGSAVAFPLLFMGPTLSPHAVYTPSP